MSDQIRKHRTHTHPVSDRVKPIAIQCGWRHQLTDNMSIDSAKRLFDSLMNDLGTVQPWHSRLGNWLIGRGNTNDDS